MVGYYDQIIPADLYKEQLTAVDLQRSLLNCSACPAVTCKSHRLENPASNKKIHIIFEQFSDGAKDSPEMQFLEPVLNWLNIQENDIFITSSHKCEKGVAATCSSHIIEEIVHYEPQLVIYLGKKPPAFTSRSLQPGQYESIHKSLLLYTHATDQWGDRSLYEQACQHLWQAVTHLNQQEEQYA